MSALGAAFAGDVALAGAALAGDAALAGAALAGAALAGAPSATIRGASTGKGSQEPKCLSSKPSTRAPN